jgi:hypothetical protein
MRSIRSAAFLVALSACSARPTLRDPHEHQLAITIHNESGVPLCDVHIYLIHNTDRGHNWLQSQREIESGGKRDFWVAKEDPARTYQVQATSCAKGNLEATGYAPSVHMNGPAHVVLFDDGKPASKDAATALAHANENTTLIPAKFTRRSAR